MERQIGVTTEVFAAIWAARRDGEDRESDILKRILSSSVASPSIEPLVDGPSDSGDIGFYDIRNDVTFPSGFKIFRDYKGRQYEATAVGQRWRREDTGETFRSLNRLNHSIVVGQESVWKGNWTFLQDGIRKSLGTLRRP